MRYFRADLVQRPTGGTCALLCGNVPHMSINRNPPPLAAPIPALLLEEGSWIEFCDRIDEALAPLTEIKIRNARVSCCLLGSILALVLLTPFLIRYWMSVSNKLGDLCYFLFFTFFCVPIIGFCYLAHSAKDMEVEKWYEINGICQEVSDLHPGLRFTLKRRMGDNRFIEVRSTSAVHGNRPSTPETVSSSKSFQEREEEEMLDI